MHKKSKANILGSYIDIIDFAGAIDQIKTYIRLKKPTQVITLNAEIVYNAQEDKKLQKIINQADLVTPDGIGIVWAARRLGWEVKERVTGIDMVYNICEEAEKEGYKIYLLGAAPEVITKAAANLRQDYPQLNIVGTKDGYFTEEEIANIIDEIKKARPDILLVALGAPKQEYFIDEHKEALEVPVSIGVGGSFDVIAGVKKRAPAIFIKLNLEWLYRLITEPSRIKRQLVLPKFVWAVLRQGKRN